MDPLQNPPDWLVDCNGFNSPLRQYFSPYRAVESPRAPGGIGDNSKIFFYLSKKKKKKVLSPLVETVLIMGHKICFYREKGLIIPKLSLLSIPIWSTDPLNLWSPGSSVG